MSFLFTAWGRRVNVNMFDEIILAEANKKEFEETHVVGGTYQDKNMEPVALFAGSEEECQQYLSRFDAVFNTHNLHK